MKLLKIIIILFIIIEIQTLITGVVSGVIAAITYYLFSRLTKPRIKISNEISKDKDNVYRIKFINKTLCDIEKISLEMFLLKQQVCDKHGNKDYNMKPLNLKTPEYTYLSGKLFKDKKTNNNCVQVTINEDLNILWSDPNDILIFQITAHHKYIYSQANILGLKKSEEFLKTAESGRIVKGMVIGKETWFKKGQVPRNKGKKQHEYMTAEGIARSSTTRFKKGNKPQNYKPVGSERITSYGYTEVKIEDPNKWKPKHKIIYESHYNCTIPKGHKCIFIDGDKTNFDISNLIVEAPAVAIRRNTINRYSAELKSFILLIQIN